METFSGGGSEAGSPQDTTRYLDSEDGMAEDTDHSSSAHDDQNDTVMVTVDESDDRRSDSEISLEKDTDEDVEEVNDGIARLLDNQQLDGVAGVVIFGPFAFPYEISEEKTVFLRHGQQIMFRR